MRWFDRLLMVLYFTDIMGKMVAMCQKTSDKYFCINFWPCKEICMRNKYMTETQCLGGSTIHSLVTFLKTKVTSDYWVASAFHWRTGLLSDQNCLFLVAYPCYVCFFNRSRLNILFSAPRTWLTIVVVNSLLSLDKFWNA